MDFDVYGVGGPYLEAGAYAELRVNLLANPWWTIDAGLRAEVGLSLDLWFFKASFQGPHVELTRSRAANAPGAYPGPGLGSGDPPTGTAGRSYDVVLPASGGAPPYSYWRVSGSIPPGLTLRTDGHLVGTPSEAGTWSFTYRVIDSTGNRSGSDRGVTVSIAAPPPPSAVTLSKGGSALGRPGCSSPSCAYLDVSVSGFSANATVTIVCRASNGDEGGWYSYTRTTDGNGNGFWPGSSGGCYYGYAGRQVWVTVNGTESNHVTW
jgi:hypothetical protein